MVIGVLELTLAITEGDSLKSKRKVLKSLIDRVQNRFNVSIAEVDLNDDHLRAMIGIAAVANDRSFVNSVLDKVQDAIVEFTLGRADILESRMELIQY